MPKGKKAAGKQTVSSIYRRSARAHAHAHAVLQQATPLETVIEANEQQPTATTNSDEGASESSEQWLRNVITPIEAARVHLEATMTDTRAYLRQVQEERWRSSDLGKWCADKDRKLERLSIDPTSVEPPKQNISWNPKKEDVVRIEFLFDICTISIRKNFDGSTEEMQEMMADFIA